MNAHDFALIAQEAYTAAPDIGVADSASRAILRHTDAGLVVAFPGTDNVACYAADFDIEPFDVAGVGKVYKGFFDAWEAISLPVLAAVAGQPVTLVGHSLGAAIALMCAAYMTVGGNPPAAVYGFEPPRVGVDMGVRTALANVPVFLFRNGNDVVPDVPPGGYHAAMLTLIGKPAFPFPNLTDHEIARVIAALATEQETTQ
jgi:triacylglycerol lipase